MTPVDDLAAWLTQVWDEQEALAKNAALASGWDGFGESRIASGSEWVASYHIVKRKRAEAQPTESRKGRELADCGNLSLDRARFIAANDPASVLARIAADRQILAEYVARDKDVDLMLGPDCLRQREWSGLRLALRIKAAQYRSRPGFNPDWLVESERAHP